MFKTLQLEKSFLVFRSFGFWSFEFVLKLGPRPQGGESGGPISIFGFRILLHSRIATEVAPT